MIDTRSAPPPARSASAPATARSVMAREVGAAAVGNALEWFDFVIYGYFANIIARLFFPAAGPLGSLLLTAGTFGVGFVMRPLGSVLMGLYADRVGRKAALSLSIWMMMAGTFVIVIAPTYAQAGWLGAFMLVFARLMQGFAASGEYGSAVSFLVEKAPPARRNLFVSIQMSTTMLAIVIGGVLGVGLTQWLSADQLEAWGWRMPFVVGLLIGPVGYYIRKHVSETESFAAATTLSARDVLGRLFGRYRRATVTSIGVTIIGTVAFYLNLVYMPTFAVRQLGLPMSAPFLSTAVAGMVMVVTAPLAGWLADVTQRPARWFGAGVLVLAVATWPLYAWVIAQPSLSHLLIMQAALGFPMGVVSALIPAVVSRVFPVEVRSTGLSLSYNLPTTIFGGFSPLIVTLLIAQTGSKAAPAFYIVAAAMVTLVALWAFPSRTQDTLSH